MDSSSFQLNNCWPCYTLFSKAIHCRATTLFHFITEILQSRTTFHILNNYLNKTFTRKFIDNLVSQYHMQCTFTMAFSYPVCWLPFKWGKVFHILDFEWLNRRYIFLSPTSLATDCSFMIGSGLTIT